MHEYRNLSLSLCFSLMFPLRTSSILIRSFRQVSKFPLILPFQNGSSVLLPFLPFIISILSVVTYAVAYIKEFSSVICVWILLTNLLTFPTSASSFVLSHDFSDGNPILCYSCIVSRILSQRPSSSGLISSYNFSAVKTLGSPWVSDVVAWSGASVVRSSVVSVSWYS